MTTESGKKVMEVPTGITGYHVHHEEPDPPFEAGVDEAWWSQLCACTNREDVQELALVRLATYGDYDNSCEIERSNHQRLLEDFPESFVKLFGDYGAAGLLIPLDQPVAEDLILVLEELAKYPVYDEEDADMLRMQMAQDAWASFGLDDLARETAKRLGVDYGDFDEWLEARGRGYDVFDDVWGECEELDYDYEIESGGIVYFSNLDELAEKIAEKLREVAA